MTDKTATVNIGTIRLLGSLCVLAVLLTLQPLRASQVQARLDSSRARIGDRLTLTVTAHSSAGETVSFPEVESHLNKFELLDELPAERVQEEGGASLVRRSWVIAAFETGALEVPGLPFAVMDSVGTVDTLWTQPQGVQILSMVQDTLNARLRPIRDLIAVPRLWKRIAFWSAVAVAVLVVLIVLWRKYLKRRREKLAGIQSAAPQRPAHLVAQEELDALKGLGLIEKGEIKRFHILVSEIVRRYLEGRFAVVAPEMTTWELTAVLRPRRDIDEALKELIRVFLEDCDLVKFAKYQPKIVEINATFNRACEIVEKSRPAQYLPESGDNQPDDQRQEAPQTVSGGGGEAR